MKIDLNRDFSATKREEFKQLINSYFSNYYYKTFFSRVRDITNAHIFKSSDGYLLTNFGIDRMVHMITDNQFLHYAREQGFGAPLSDSIMIIFEEITRYLTSHGLLQSQEHIDFLTKFIKEYELDYDLIVRYPEILSSTKILNILQRTSYNSSISVNFDQIHEMLTYYDYENRAALEETAELERFEKYVQSKNWCSNGLMGKFGIQPTMEKYTCKTAKLAILLGLLNDHASKSNDFSMIRFVGKEFGPQVIEIMKNYPRYFVQKHIQTFYSEANDQFIEPIKKLQSDLKAYEEKMPEIRPESPEPEAISNMLSQIRNRKANLKEVLQKRQNENKEEAKSLKSSNKLDSQLNDELKKFDRRRLNHVEITEKSKNTNLQSELEQSMLKILERRDQITGKSSSNSSSSGKWTESLRNSKHQPERSF